MRRPCVVEGCDQPYNCRDMCKAHYSRWLRHGDPDLLLCRSQGALRAELDAAAADPSEGPCVILDGLKSRASYMLEGKSMRASRVVWILANGDPGPLFVLHTCGNGVGNCIRLAHLYLGTPADNSADMVRDGHSTRGSRHRLAKLDEEKVASIRRLLADGHSHRAIADEFGVSKATVTAISTRQTWAWSGSE